MAFAGVLVEPEDEADLAQTLADAQEEQEVCYGWTIVVNGQMSDLGSRSTARASRWHRPLPQGLRDPARRGGLRLRHL
jgi:hypothetical protein